MAATTAAAPRHSCAKLSVAVEDPKAAGGGSVFVKATWLPTRFSLAVTDGTGAMGRRRLRRGGAAPRRAVGPARRRVPQPRRALPRLPTAHLVLLLPPRRQRQSKGQFVPFEEVVRKTQSFDKLKQESEKCLEQSERFNKEKAEFEEATFTKFVAVLNSKKAKLRQLRDKISELESADKPPEEGEEEEQGGNSTDRTELFEEGSDKEASVNDEPSKTGSGDHHSSPEKSGATFRGKQGRKRTRK
ncbi:hypothetical protein PR202_ga13405 [Eleusine coracana subsp. coracana]|uniref:XRCC4 coiled-coil domain-containing protein n=1 Tax=Eleusine coracana subsp. coracana TaxID=191504 RepID=A0AAV5CEQ4_ELECO|nr:hypothetical protein PR202_ga13405 [Eleusine coracana subsp. coracana]